MIRVSEGVYEELSASSIVASSSWVDQALEWRHRTTWTVAALQQKAAHLGDNNMTRICFSRWKVAWYLSFLIHQFASRLLSA